jgi:hypothetical protein
MTIERSSAAADPPQTHDLGPRWPLLPDLRGRLASLIGDFRTSLRQHGFNEARAVPITARVDPTVRFVGSVISVLKPVLIEERIPPGGVSLAQPVLRTMNLHRARDPEHHPRWPSYFLQLGAITAPESRHSAAEAALVFLHRQVPDCCGRLVLQAVAEDEDLIRLHPPGLSTHADSGGADAYRHHYGVPDLVGRTLNYALRGVNGEVHPIGNLILLELSGRPIAAELAFGPSNLLTRLEGLDLPIQATAAAEAVPLRDWTHIRLADTLAPATVLLREGLRPLGSGRHRVARSYLQALSVIRRQAGMSLDELRACSDRFLRADPPAADDLPARICRYIAAYEELEADVMLDQARRNALAAKAF